MSILPGRTARSSVQTRSMPRAGPGGREGGRSVWAHVALGRGTTSRKIVKMLRNAGAKEVHMRISSPPIFFPCFYGIDTPTRQELIASNHTIDEIKNYITDDSLSYLSTEGMLSIVPDSQNRFCTACFEGDYPIPFTKEEVIQLGLFEDWVKGAVKN